MPRIPNAVFDRYVAHLIKKKIPPARFAEYRKWLRYYLDFCDKYSVPANEGEREWLFCGKLKEKKQSETERESRPEVSGLLISQIVYFLPCMSNV